MPPRLHNHYFKDVSKLEYVDVYRVLQLFNVTDPCIQHAIKKLLVAGGRGAGKDISRDIQEAVDSLVRWNEMRQEEQRVLEYLVRYEVASPEQVIQGSPKAGRIESHAANSRDAINNAKAAFAAQNPGVDPELYAWEARLTGVPESL